MVWRAGRREDMRDLEGRQDLEHMQDRRDLKDKQVLTGWGK